MERLSERKRKRQPEADVKSKSRVSLKKETDKDIYENSTAPQPGARGAKKRYEKRRWCKYRQAHVLLERVQMCKPPCADLHLPRGSLSPRTSHRRAQLKKALQPDAAPGQSSRLGCWAKERSFKRGALHLHPTLYWLSGELSGHGFVS